MKNQRKSDLYIRDMITSMERIASYIKGHNFESFEKDFMLIDAVIRNFEVIGEASKKNPQSVQNEYPEVPWKKMYQLRNIVSHEYFNVDHEIIWRVATVHLPSNEKKDLKEVLKKRSLRS